MLTRRGAMVAAATVATYVVAALAHYPELGVLSAGGLIALAVGVGWVLRRPNVEVQRTIEPTRVTRGEVALGLLRVSNPGHISVSPTLAEERCGARTVRVAIPRLAPGAATRTTYALPTTRRAVVDVGPLVVAREDPLGCWRTARQLDTTERLWVHPVVHPLVALPAGRTRSLDGPDRDRLPHGSITFHALREYVPGDDLRHIHWRSSAHTGSLMVKDHVDTSLPTVTLLLDTGIRSYGEDRFEEAVEVAASLVALVTAARLPLRLLTTGGSGVQGRGAAGDGQEMLDLLAAVDRAERGSLAELANQLASQRRGDTLLVVTGTASAGDLRAVGALGARYNHGVVAIVANEPHDVDVPVPPTIRVVRSTTAADFARSWDRVALR